MDAATARGERLRRRRPRAGAARRPGARVRDRRVVRPRGPLRLRRRHVRRVRPRDRAGRVRRRALVRRASTCSANPTCESSRSNVDSNGASATQFDVLTVAEATAQRGETVREFLGFFTFALLGFAAIGVVVGAFVIFNTFTILVTQRTRELGLLRAMGASGPQVVGSVVLEALLVGGDRVGDRPRRRRAPRDRPARAAARARAPPPRDEHRARRADRARLAGGRDRRHGRGVVAPGTPRRTRVADGSDQRRGAAREREHAGPRGRGHRDDRDRSRRDRPRARCEPKRSPACSNRWKWWRSARSCCSSGSSCCSPRSRARSQAPSVVRCARLGPSGVLARANAMRNPRRTAVTASALVIGLALVGLTATFGASAKASVRRDTASGLLADFVVKTDGFAGFSTVVGRTARDAAGARRGRAAADRRRGRRQRRRHGRRRRPEALGEGGVARLRQRRRRAGSKAPAGECCSTRRPRIASGRRSATSWGCSSRGASIEPPAQRRVPQRQLHRHLRPGGADHRVA